LQTPGLKVDFKIRSNFKNYLTPNWSHGRWQLLKFRNSILSIREKSISRVIYHFLTFFICWLYKVSYYMRIWKCNICKGGHPVLPFNRSWTTEENRPEPPAYFPVQLGKTGALQPEPPGNCPVEPEKIARIFRNRRTGYPSLNMYHNFSWNSMELQRPFETVRTISLKFHSKMLPKKKYLTLATAAVRHGRPSVT